MFIPAIAHVESDYFAGGYWVFPMVGEWPDGTVRIDGAYWTWR